MTKKKEPGNVRHEARCSICSDERRQEIEQDFVAWVGPSRIAKKYKVTRDALYRHAHALDLMSRRRQNVRAALERMIERSDYVKVNAGVVVQAVSVYARLNARGELIERQQTVNMNQLYDRMSDAETDHYCKTGDVPKWFKEALARTGIESKENVTH
jgi:hypothetical protein